MPILTNLMGHDFAFRSDAVVAVADRDAESGAEMTCVYGLGSNFQKIRETVDDFLNRIGVRDKFASFTRPNGTTIWICAPSVTVVTIAQDGLFGADVKSVISAGGFTQAVKEPMSTVRTALSAAGSTI